jgi:enoyl-CoA hydratase
LDKVLLRTEERIAIVTINRPEKRNALNDEVRSDLHKTLDLINGRGDIQVAIVTGAGDAFVAGADIASMKDRTPEDAVKASKHGSDIFLFMENMRIPFIAAINGWALGGGCELALACDIRICSDKALLGQPEVKIGIIPGYGALVRLSRLIGPARAKELIYTGRLISALEARSIGLVNEVVPHEKLMDRAMEVSKQIAAGPAAICFAKQAINKSLDLETREAMEFCSNLYGETCKTQDSKEGILAYLENRKPRFIGK